MALDDKMHGLVLQHFCAVAAWLARGAIDHEVIR